MLNKNYKSLKRIVAVSLLVIVFFNLLCCTHIERDSIDNSKSNNSNIFSKASISESDTTDLSLENDTDLLATSNEVVKTKSSVVSTKSDISKLESSKIYPDTSFMNYFKLDQVPIVKKYKYDNLELLYNLEQYFNFRFSNKIEDYFVKNYDAIIEKLGNTVFLGDTNVDNIYLKYSLLKKKNVFGMPNQSIVDELMLINDYDFTKMDNVIILNGFTNKELIDSDKYISVCDKIIDSIKSKNANAKIFICSLLPVSVATLDPYLLERYNIYNLKSIEINNALLEHYKDYYIDISFLIEAGDFEFNANINKNLCMKIIAYLANYLEVKYKIIDAPMPTLNEPTYKEPTGKNIYMTFDDGPSVNGSNLLSILNKYDVKATMFYTGNGKDFRQNIIDFYNSNQEIAAHTFTHNFKIYESEEKYFDDLYKIESLLKSLTGKFTRIVRLPGGSTNTTSKKYSIGIMKKIIEDFKYMGYTYYDWNVSSGDGSKNITSEQILANAKAGVKKYDNSVVLFHETHDYTVAVIEDFIKWAKSEGYEFRTLDYDTLKCHQSYSKLN